MNGTIRLDSHCLDCDLLKTQQLTDSRDSVQQILVFSKTYSLCLHGACLLIELLIHVHCQATVSKTLVSRRWLQGKPQMVMISLGVKIFCVR